MPRVQFGLYATTSSAHVPHVSVREENLATAGQWVIAREDLPSVHVYNFPPEQSPTLGREQWDGCQGHSCSRTQRRYHVGSRGGGEHQSYEPWS